MLEACGRSAWNLKNDHKMPNYWCVLLSSVWDSYDNPFKSPSRNCCLFSPERDEVIVNLWSRLDLKEKRWERWHWRESVQFIISFLLHNKLVPIGVISSWSLGQCLQPWSGREKTKGKKCSLGFSRRSWERKIISAEGYDLMGNLAWMLTLPNFTIN